MHLHLAYIGRFTSETIFFGALMTGTIFLVNSFLILAEVFVVRTSTTVVQHEQVAFGTIFLQDQVLDIMGLFFCGSRLSFK